MSQGTPSGLFGPPLGPETVPLLPRHGDAGKPGHADATIVYPESDGKPMADNTKQFLWIVVLQGNLAALFRDRADVWVWGNLMWYAQENEPDENAAPDVFVVFGRPKGHRSSYKQWEENNVPLTVVFEVLSPGNDVLEMADKLAFYDEHGVEEYFLFDPDTNRLVAYRRGREALRRVWPPEALVSPRLGIRFDLSGPEMVVSYPDGRRFLTFEELEAERQRQQQRAEAAEKRAARLAELSRKVRRGQASAEELAELERLEAEASPS
jgi:Uma2 family endonuclease